GLAHVDALAGHDRAHSDRGEGALRAPRLSGVRPAEEPSLAARLVMKTMTAKTKAKATKPLQLLLLGGSGFVGRALLRELASRPASVRVRALLRTPSAVPDYPFLEKVEGSLERVPRDLEPVGPYVLV